MKEKATKLLLKYIEHGDTTKHIPSNLLSFIKLISTRDVLTHLPKNTIF